MGSREQDLKAIVREMSNRLEQELKTVAKGLQGLHQRLDRIELSLRSREGTALDDEVVEAKAVKPDISLGLSNPGTSTFTSNANSTPFVKSPCYVNWIQETHKGLKELQFVNFHDLLTTIDDILKQANGFNAGTGTDFSIDKISTAKNAVRRLRVWKITKFKRFPSNGNYININPNSERNAELKKMLTATDVSTFKNAATNYRGNILKPENTMDQCSFEILHNLVWVIPRSQPTEMTNTNDSELC